MDEKQFLERTAKIRVRFVDRLVDNIRRTHAVLPRLAGDSRDVIEAVALTYRRFHDISGLGSILGLDATGRAARTLDLLLFSPFRDCRGLSEDEVHRLKHGLENLTLAARIEIPPMDQNLK